MTQHDSKALQDHEVVSHEEWIAARKALLAEEKVFTHRREELARHRRALPWERVEKEYVPRAAPTAPSGPITMMPHWCT